MRIMQARRRDSFLVFTNRSCCLSGVVKFNWRSHLPARSRAEPGSAGKGTLGTNSGSEERGSAPSLTDDLPGANTLRQTPAGGAGGQIENRSRARKTTIAFEVSGSLAGDVKLVR